MQNMLAASQKFSPNNSYFLIRKFIGDVVKYIMVVFLPHYPFKGRGKHVKFIQVFSPAINSDSPFNAMQTMQGVVTLYNNTTEYLYCREKKNSALLVFRSHKIIIIQWAQPH
jgi:hypothetical protein